jgi:hypothetical protein
MPNKLLAALLSAALASLLLFSACTKQVDYTLDGDGKADDRASAGTTFVTFIESAGAATPSAGTGKIAVQVTLPEKSRFEDSAPIVVIVPPFFTEGSVKFTELKGITDEGFIEITLLYPGRSTLDGVQSDGIDDFGGENSMEALKDATLFAAGKIPNRDGKLLNDLIQIRPDFENIGFYAFSHPGIIATKTLAKYEELSVVDYFVGRENPTVDKISAMEIGYFKGEEAYSNPLYKYPKSYAEGNIKIDYSSAKYDFERGMPYIDNYVLGEKVPTMFGKRCYSVDLLTALRDNGALSAADWPSDLATPEEAAEIWPLRSITAKDYERIGKINPNLKVMLIFAEVDHVQTVPDKPHIHMAYDGFKNAGIWVRLDPDKYGNHSANTEPADWIKAAEWGYNGDLLNQLVPVAGVMEMANRVNGNMWADDLPDLK